MTEPGADTAAEAVPDGAPEPGPDTAPDAAPEPDPAAEPVLRAKPVADAVPGPPLSFALSACALVLRELEFATAA